MKNVSFMSAVFLHDQFFMHDRLNINEITLSRQKERKSRKATTEIDKCTNISQEGSSSHVESNPRLLRVHISAITGGRERHKSKNRLKKSTKLSGYCSACVPAAGHWRAGGDFGVEL